MHESPRHGCALLFAAGELSGVVSSTLDKPNTLQESEHASIVASSGQGQRQRNVLSYGQVGHQVELLEYHANHAPTQVHELMFLGACEVETAYAHLTFIWPIYARQQVEQRALAATGRSHQCHGLSGIQGEINARYCDDGCLVLGVDLHDTAHHDNGEDCTHGAELCSAGFLVTVVIAEGSNSGAGAAWSLVCASAVSAPSLRSDASDWPPLGVLPSRMNLETNLLDNQHRSSRHGDGWRLERTQVIARPLPEVWAFFERPENLESITPDFLRFHILTPKPVPMHKDAWIQYRLRLHGIPVNWRTQITRHEPPYAFVDEQKEGPFARWVHLHEFREHPEGTWMLDRVDYKEPMGVLGWVAHHVYTRRLVERIFEYRRGVIRERLEPQP